VGAAVVRGAATRLVERGEEVTLNVALRVRPVIAEIDSLPSSGSNASIWP
jgi:hypothetical protein